MAKKTSVSFRIIRCLVRLFFGKMEVVGLENLPSDHAVIVANHCQMNGPIAGELFMPDNCYTWCAGQMMHLKEVPDYAFEDFWSGKPKWLHPYYRLLSHIIAPLAVCIFNNARTVPVYKDMRIMSTFKETLRLLKEGRNILIFPEKNEKNNHILYQFQENFIDIAKLYYKQTGIELTFVPMYIAPRLKKMYIGQGVSYCADNEITQERKRIAACMTDAITNIATDLPEHIVVPYRNLPKKYYLTNKDADKRPGEMEMVHIGKLQIRKPVVDYTEFRFSKLKEPRFHHLLYLSGWIGYFTLYFLTENLIPREECYPVHCFLDDIVPFCEYFVIPYVGWYGLIVFSLLYFALYHPDKFKKLMTFIIVTQICAMVVYILFPNRQDLRPAEFERKNIFTWILGLIYRFDTSTNVCPSLHVAYSVGIASTWLKEKSASKALRRFIVIFCFFVCISVAFVKQHSVVDIFAAIPICILAELIAFGRSYWRRKEGVPSHA